MQKSARFEARNVVLPPACDRSAAVALPFLKNVDRLRPSGIVTTTLAVPPATARGDFGPASQSAR
jgi:hypothetical protein